MSKTNLDNKKINELLKDLDATVEWFQSRQDVDVQEGLKKVKEGGELIKILKAKLATIENEFQEIKKDFDDDNG